MIRGCGRWSFESRVISWIWGGELLIWSFGVSISASFCVFDCGIDSRLELGEMRCPVRKLLPMAASAGSPAFSDAIFLMSFADSPFSMSK